MNDELQIIDLEVGAGKAAVKGALITTQYTGWLEDGTEFDSSYSRGKPFQCVIGTGRVIKGWEQQFYMWVSCFWGGVQEHAFLCEICQSSSAMPLQIARSVTSPQSGMFAVRQHHEDKCCNVVLSMIFSLTAAANSVRLCA